MTMVMKHIWMIFAFIFVVLVMLGKRRIRCSSNCYGLLHGGEYDGNATLGKWVTAGCQLKMFSTRESEECMRTLPQRKMPSKPILTFIGDSRVRQLRDALYRHFTGIALDWLSNKSINYNYNIHEKHDDTLFELPSVDIQFFWTTDIAHAVEKTRKYLKAIMQGGNYPDLLIIGNGVWSIRFCRNHQIREDHCQDIYERYFQRMLPILAKLAKRIPVLWVPQHVIGEEEGNREFSDRNAEMYNDIIRSALKKSKTNKVLFWESFGSTFHISHDSLDRLHIGPVAAYINIHIILNFLCNRHRETNSQYCCSLTTTQIYEQSWFMFVFGLSVLLFLISFAFRILCGCCCCMTTLI